jgi:hypothetical protein
VSDTRPFTFIEVDLGDQPTILYRCSTCGNVAVVSTESEETPDEIAETVGREHHCRTGIGGFSACHPVTIANASESPALDDGCILSGMAALLPWPEGSRVPKHMQPVLRYVTESIFVPLCHRKHLRSFLSSLRPSHHDVERRYWRNDASRNRLLGLCGRRKWATARGTMHGRFCLIQLLSPR